MKLFGAVWCRSVGLSRYFVLLRSFYVFQFLVPITSLHGKFSACFSYFVSFAFVFIYFLVCFLFFSPLVSVCVTLPSFIFLLFLCLVMMVFGWQGVITASQ